MYNSMCIYIYTQDTGMLYLSLFDLVHEEINDPTFAHTQRTHPNNFNIVYLVYLSSEEE